MEEVDKPSDRKEKKPQAYRGTPPVPAHAREAEFDALFFVPTASMFVMHLLKIHGKFFS
jgi:hypothetical protein